MKSQGNILPSGCVCWILLFVILKLERVPMLHCKLRKLYVLNIFQTWGTISLLRNDCELQAETNPSVFDIMQF